MRFAHLKVFVSLYSVVTGTANRNENVIMHTCINTAFITTYPLEVTTQCGKSSRRYLDITQRHKLLNSKFYHVKHVEVKQTTCRPSKDNDDTDPQYRF